MNIIFMRTAPGHNNTQRKELDLEMWNNVGELLMYDWITTGVIIMSKDAALLTERKTGMFTQVRGEHKKQLGAV